LDLRSLVPAYKKDDYGLALLGEIDPIAGVVMNSPLRNVLSYEVTIACPPRPDYLEQTVGLSMLSMPRLPLLRKINFLAQLHSTFLN